MHQISCLVRLALASATCLLLATRDPAAGSEGPPVNAGRPSGQQLCAPADRESFDFMIFGDRTGGPPEGIEVLKQGVQLANRLDVDLVLTVGDLVEGYNLPDRWLTQMREFKDAMSDLRMPWYPVAGNHDVYARPQRPDGHKNLYSEHFGPLYYSFDYKWAHFIVLFSDEALSFRDPARNQNFSPEQMAWLRTDLAATDAAQILVFLHHPRWTKRYAGCNWDDVHHMFVRDGRPITVFAGHVHLYRSDGWIDNVHYYTLATTGGHLGRYQQSAALHHADFVRVRPDRITVAVLPIGSVLSDDFVLGAEVDAMDELARGAWVAVQGEAAVGMQAGQRSSLAVTLTNPTDRPLRLSAEMKAAPGWRHDCQPLDRELAPGESLRVQVQVTAPALSSSAPRVSVRATAHYPLRSGLIQPVEIETQVPIQALLPEDATGTDPLHNGVLTLDGASAIRLDVPHLLECYTLECWARGGPPKGTAALLAKTQNSAYGIFWSAESDGIESPTGFVGTADGYLILPAAQAWEWDQWTHLAVVFVGGKATFYVDGEPRAEQTTAAAPTHNRHPLYVGADPNWRGMPGSFFTGMIDEVRLSAGARYTAPFSPPRAFQRDDDTVLLLHFDRDFGALFPDDSGNKRHGWASGHPRIERVQR